VGLTSNYFVYGTSKAGTPSPTIYCTCQVLNQSHCQTRPEENPFSARFIKCFCTIRNIKSSLLPHLRSRNDSELSFVDISAVASPAHSIIIASRLRSMALILCTPATDFLLRSGAGGGTVSPLPTPYPSSLLATRDPPAAPGGGLGETAGGKWREYEE